MQTTVRTATHTTPPALPRRLVRKYASFRAFHRDARALYASAHYTISDTAGLAHWGLRESIAFYWPHRRHLVITYDLPTHPWPAPADAG